jgi:hypothetical protein
MSTMISAEGGAGPAGASGRAPRTLLLLGLAGMAAGLLDPRHGGKSSG